MKRVLLTGATGFIGRRCQPLLLANGYEVHAVSSRLPQETCSDVYWHQANLLDFSQVPMLIADVLPTHLLHFAWYAEPGKYWTALENFHWVQASLGLLQEFYSHGGGRVVMAGTCAEYDWKYGYCSERITPLAPATLYGTCKHSLQTMLDVFSKETGLSSAWGRIFFLYGPHEHPARLISSVICALLQGQPARCSHGNQIRDFLHVEDVADAFVALLESDVMGPVNIASGEPVVLKDVVYKIADTLGKRDLVQLGAIPAQDNEPRVLIADFHRLSDEVGWQAKYDLDTGLEHTIKWWKTNHFSPMNQERK